MKVVFRLTIPGRTCVARRGFDHLPTRAEIDAVVSEALAEANFVPATNKVAKKKATKA